MNESQATPIRGALRDVQEMWEELHRRGLNPQIMRRYSDAISVLERDFTARLANGVPERETANNWQQYAREGETAQACIERHRLEQDSLLKLLAQAREPLTDQQIISLVPAGWTGMLAQVMEFARRIERARTDGVKTGEGSSND